MPSFFTVKKTLIQNSTCGSGSDDACVAPSTSSPSGHRVLTSRPSLLKWLLQFLHKHGPANLPLKVLMTAAAATLLSGAVNGAADVKMKESDVLVYCAIYCGWVICFLPDTLVHLNAYVLYKLFMLFIRLFAAEIAVSLYLHVKGESDILKRGLSLRPLVGPSFQWMVELVHSVRFVLIVGCLSASTVAHLFDRPEILGVEFMEEEPQRE